MNPHCLADTHTHTHLCRHANGVPLDYARSAARLGIPEIACTDHVHFPNDPYPSIRMRDDEFSRYLQDVQEAQAAGLCTVLLGIEADYQRDLVAAHLPAVLGAADFDIVLGSLHTGPFWDLSPEDPVATPAFIEQMNRTYFRRMAELAHTRLFDVCAHFDLVKRTGLRPSDAFLAEVVPPALDAVAEAGMAIELNTSGLEHGAKEIYPSLQILAWMNEREIPITFGSDSHHPDQLGRHFEKALAMAKAAGYTHRTQFRRRKQTPVPLPP